MYTAEVIKREVQRNRSFQVRQLARKGIRQPGQAAKLHSHGQILPLDKRRADVSGIGITLTNFGYNLRDAWWGVPLVSELPVISVQLGQLSKVNVGPKALFDGLAVENVGIGGELDTASHAAVQIADKKLRVDAAALPNIEGGNQFAVGVQRNVNPLVAKLGGIVLSDTLGFFGNERPDFVTLKVRTGKVTHRGIHRATAAFSSHYKQAHDRVAVESGESFCTADRATLKKALDRSHCRLGIRQQRVTGEPFVRLAEGGLQAVQRQR
jgi:hypothetical protein